MGKKREWGKDRTRRLPAPRVSPGELKLAKARAKARGMTLYEYIRQRVLEDVDINLPQQTKTWGGKEPIDDE